ncbi:MAG: hypothetical protein ACOCXQ_01420 [Patescibacteria group bacterium]
MEAQDGHIMQGENVLRQQTQTVIPNEGDPTATATMQPTAPSPQPDPAGAARLGTGYRVEGSPSVNLRRITLMPDGSTEVQILGTVPSGTQVCQWATEPVTIQIDGQLVRYLQVQIVSQVPQAAEDGEYKQFENWDGWIAENLLIEDPGVACASVTGGGERP